MPPSTKPQALSEHLLLGDSIDENGDLSAPFYLPREVLNEHAYICGQTGSGKTSVGFIPLLHQLTRPYKKPLRLPDGSIMTGEDGRPEFTDLGPLWHGHRPPVVVLDLKGDPALFNSARAFATQHGYPFRFFSIDETKSSHVFDPFQNLQPRSPIEFCELLLSALSLCHGDEYGENYFASQHRFALLKALSPTPETRRHVRDWKHLWELLLPTQTGGKSKDPTRKLSRDATHLLTVIFAMTYYPQMRLDGREKDAADVIHMPTVIRDRQMVYFWLPAESAMSVREIGKLALYALHTAAKEHAERARPVQTYVFIDEFHLLASEKLDRILTTARSRGLTFLLANQYPAALRLKSFDLRATVMNSTRLKQFFTITSTEDLRELVELSGEKTEYLESFGWSNRYSPDIFGGRLQTGSSDSYGLREARTPRLNRDMLRRISADQLSSLVWITRDGGFANLEGVPQWVRALWPMSQAEYERFRVFQGDTAWPSVESSVRTVSPQETKRAKAEQAQNLAGVLSAQEMNSLFDELAAGQGLPAVAKNAKSRKAHQKKRKQGGAPPRESTPPQHPEQKEAKKTRNPDGV